MKKRKMCLALVLCLFLQLVVLTTPAAAVETTMEKANALRDLGLFRGSDKGFELERAPNRVEGLVMLIRLMGAETAALTENNSHPFTDVPAWADPYVGFAYQNGIVNGVSTTGFGSKNVMSVNQYITMLLRLLGYSDQNGVDFTWDKALEKAVEIRMFTSGQADDLRREQPTRGTLVYISWAALTQPFKGETVYTLTRYLVEVGVFTEAQARMYGLWNEVGKPYLTDTLVLADIASKWHMTMDGTDGLIYYDQVKGEINRIDLANGKRGEPVQLLDVNNATLTVNIEGTATTYTDLDVEQVYADDVNQRLIVSGVFNKKDAAASGGWTNAKAPETYRGYYVLKDKTLEVLYSCPQGNALYYLNHIFETQKNGKYVIGDDYRNQKQRLRSWKPERDELTDIGTNIWEDDISVAQIGSDLYAVRSGYLYQFNFSSQSWESVMQVGVTQDTVSSRNGAFYICCVDDGYGDYLGKMIAVRPDGLGKVMFDYNEDIDIIDLNPIGLLPECLITTDETFVFYDDDAGAIRIIYQNPDI